MAFSKAPSQSTYQTESLDLAAELQSREYSSGRDPVILNGILEYSDNKKLADQALWLKKRDGSSRYPQDIPSSTVRGLYYWEDADKFFVVFESTLVICTGSSGTFEYTEDLLSTTEGEVGFTEFYYDDGTSDVVFTDGTTMYTCDSTNTLTEVTSVDLPTPHRPHPVFLDGYIFVVKSGTADIYNSNLNDPTAWTAGDFLTSEMIPDTLLRIARLNNYIVAFGTASVEYFFDAGNAEGSPLQRNDTPVKLVGYLGGFATKKNKIYFIGQGSTTIPEIYMLEDFKIEAIDLTALRKILQKTNTYTATIVSDSGSDFYVLSTAGLTFAMDLETKVWSRWAWKGTASMPITHSVSIPITGIGHASVFSLEGVENLFYKDPAIYQDDLENFSFQLTTRKNTYNSLHEKIMSRVIFFTDKVAGSLWVSYSDDDGVTYSTEREVDVSIERPMLHRLGRFLVRSFRLRFSDNAPFRIFKAEVDFNLGVR